MKEYSLEQLAQLLDARLEGDGSLRVNGMGAIDQGGPGKLCFAESAGLLDTIEAHRPTALLVGDDFPSCPEIGLLRVDHPRRAFVRALELFAAPHRLSGIHPSAVVADDVEIGADAGIGALVVVEAGARIGDRCQIRSGTYVGHDVVLARDCDIGPKCSLMAGTRIGSRCILHAGVVLGSDGYGYQWQDDHHHKIPQLGCVVLGDDVEIGGNTCIDRATLGETRIGDGSKLDNLVHIAHNNRIGRQVLLTGQVGIAGSSQLGDRVVMGGQSGVGDHVRIGDGVQISAQAGVTADVAAGGKVWGTPARPMTRAMREHAAVGKLPESLRQLRQQEKTLQALMERIAVLERMLDSQKG
jgi:UDP-3-O-[3-hydroxymyristoyl] glucosamine N-acyltransferase